MGLMPGDFMRGTRIACTLACLALSLFAIYWYSLYRDQSRKVALIEERGAQVLYSCNIDAGGRRKDSKWFELVRKWSPMLDADMFWRVSYVSFEGVIATNKDVEVVSKIPSITSLDLGGQPNIDDESLPYIVNLEGLTSLNCYETGFSADGIKSLRERLPKARIKWKAKDE